MSYDAGGSMAAQGHNCCDQVTFDSLLADRQGSMAAQGPKCCDRPLVQSPLGNSQEQSPRRAKNTATSMNILRRS